MTLRLVRDGFTPVAFNGEPVLDEDGKVVSVNGVTFNKEYGFGIQLRYRLSFGRDFPKPDPNTSIMLEEVVTGTLDGEKSEPFTRKIHVRSKDNVFYADDFIGLTSNKPSGPTQVRESTQILTLSATIGGVAQSFTIRVNKITIDPRAEVKIRVVEQPPSQ